METGTPMVDAKKNGPFVTFKAYKSARRRGTLRERPLAVKITAVVKQIYESRQPRDWRGSMVCEIYPLRDTPRTWAAAVVASSVCRLNESPLRRGDRRSTGITSANVVLAMPVGLAARPAPPALTDRIHEL